jgi:hypothetical protein
MFSEHATNLTDLRHLPLCTKFHLTLYRLDNVAFDNRRLVPEDISGEVLKLW